ncbi:MAG: alpha/beta hydrolase [Cyanobacteria bacterium J06623_7]
MANYLVFRNQIWSWLTLGMLQLGCCVGVNLFANHPVIAADRVILSYGVLEFDVSVDALETYAKTGEIEDELKSYADFLTPEQLEQFKVGLTTSADFSHLAIAQFLYSFQGEIILKRVSQVVKTNARQPGFYALRSALILAAADTDSGLTPLNVLKKFPTNALRVDSRQGFEIFKNLSRVVQRNAMAIAAVEQQARNEHRQLRNGVKARALRNFNLLVPGEYRYRQQKLTMNDHRRERQFPIELYIPQREKTDPAKLPLVVISHGLGSDLTTFTYLAQHLASHGFAVVVPEHPGSSSKQIEALLSGLESDVTPPQELIDRPLDIKFVLDHTHVFYIDFRPKAFG